MAENVAKLWLTDEAHMPIPLQDRERYKLPNTNIELVYSRSQDPTYDFHLHRIEPTVTDNVVDENATRDILQDAQRRLDLLYDLIQEPMHPKLAIYSALVVLTYNTGNIPSITAMLLQYKLKREIELRRSAISDAVQRELYDFTDLEQYSINCPQLYSIIKSYHEDFKRFQDHITKPKNAADENIKYLEDLKDSNPWSFSIYEAVKTIIFWMGVAAIIKELFF